jgi:hypothetical protein
MMLLVFSGNERKKIPTAIIIVVPSVIALMLTISICIFLRVRKPTDNFESKLQLISFNVASLLSVSCSPILNSSLFGDNVFIVILLILDMHVFEDIFFCEKKLFMVRKSFFSFLT